jgi:membrane protease subunit HflK
LTTGREEVRNETSKQLTATLDQYETGLKITDVTLQDANPPKEVVDAFDDAVKAREDARRFVNKAQAYRSEVIPQAKGKASRIEQAAQGFKQKVQLRAKADIQPFLAVKDVYRQAPEVTRYRIYMDSLAHALQGSKKVMLDNTANKPAFYMPMPGLTSKGHGSPDNQDSSAVKGANESNSDNSGGTTSAGSTNQNSMSNYAQRPRGYPQRGSY